MAAGCLFHVISFTHVQQRPFQASVGQTWDLEEESSGFVKVLLFPLPRCRAECHSCQRRMVALLSRLLRLEAGNKQGVFVSMIDGLVFLLLLVRLF